MKVIIWRCRTCGDVVVSYAREHHFMNYCECDGSGVDLEDYGCRMMGNPETLGLLDDDEYAPWLELSLGYLEQFGTLECSSKIVEKLMIIKDGINMELVWSS